jgi:cytochrome oxidase Cu insertion factor (SCO1/SenC/PrrC family)/ABC-type Zn2+ transport system substrate-binding protein/surface adhesin
MSCTPRLFVFLLIGLLPFFTAMDAASDERFRVVASIKPIHSILSGLMAGADEPQLLVGDGRLPYGYQLTDRQRKDLAGADMLVWVGPELEAFLIEPVGEIQRSVRVETLLDSPDLKILPSRWDEQRRDPFFWLDSRNAVILVNVLARKLMIADAPRGHLYNRNRAALLARMAELDRRLEYDYRGLKSGLAMAYYDTLQYFEQAYALKVRDSLVESPLHALSAEKLLTGRLRLAEGIYTCLITDAYMAMPDLPLLLGEAKIKRGEVDSLGTGLEAGAELYFQLMELNTRTIKQCLRPEETAAESGVTAAQEQAQAVGNLSGKFLLTDQYGKLVSDRDLLGKYQLIYFGYTHCPDICPTSLQVMSVALNKLGDKADRIQPYFITVDPERDTVAVVREYVGYFDERLIGLTGSKSMIERVAEQYRVRYEKVVEEGMDPDMYIMDHTASLFLIAPDGRFITKLAYGISADRMVEKLNQYIPD